MSRPRPAGRPGGHDDNPLPEGAAARHELAAYERYLLLERGHSPRGVRRYLYDLRLWLAFLEASGLPPGPQAVRRLMEERGFRPRRAQGVLAAIRGYYRWQREVLGRAVEDPTAPVARPRAGRRLARYPSREEIARLLEATRSEREERLLSTLIRFLYGSGLRLSEALSLRVEGLVWEGELPAAVRVVGKGDKERLVPLSPTAQEALAEWLAPEYRPWPGADGPSLPRPARGPLFTFANPAKPAHAGRVPSASWVEKAFARLRERARVDRARATPHKLRHAYSTALVEAGVALDAVKDLLGHASISTTQIYLHATPGRLAEAARKLPRLP